MARFLKALLVLLGAVIIVEPVNAETAGEMLDACRLITASPTDMRKVRIPNATAMLCWGAFSTLQDLGRYRDPDSRKGLLSFCSPPNSTRTQMIAVFIQFAEAQPANWHKDFTLVAVGALSKAFPCTGNN